MKSEIAFNLRMWANVKFASGINVVTILTKTLVVLLCLVNYQQSLETTSEFDPVIQVASI